MILRNINKIPGLEFGWLVASQIRGRLKQPELNEAAPRPSLLMLESSSLCNLDCAKCGNRSSSNSRGNMDVDLAIGLVDKAADMGIPQVCLSMLGEPLMNPMLEKIIERAAMRGLSAFFVTNATLLTPERSRSIINAGIEFIIVSFDGWDWTSYGDRHGGAEMDAILENMRRFREIRGAGSARPLLCSVTTIDTESLKHLREIKKLIGPYVDKSFLNSLTDFGIPSHSIDRKLIPGTRSWRRMPCSYFWTTLNVRWNGQVTACCNDYKHMLVYHDVAKASIKEIWKSETIRKFRRLHVERKFDHMPMCGNCTRDWINSIAFQKIKRRFDSFPID